VTRKKVALKFCGGCNPEFDRREYVQRIRAAAGHSILWVGFAEEGSDTVLLVEGCPTACAEENFASRSGRKVILIRDDKRAPEEVVKSLLGGS
jgi:hypothetical protein